MFYNSIQLYVPDFSKLFVYDGFISTELKLLHLAFFKLMCT